MAKLDAAAVRKILKSTATPADELAKKLDISAAYVAVVRRAAEDAKFRDDKRHVPSVVREVLSSERHSPKIK